MESGNSRGKPRKSKTPDSGCCQALAKGEAAREYSEYAPSIPKNPENVNPQISIADYMAEYWRDMRPYYDFFLSRGKYARK